MNLDADYDPAIPNEYAVYIALVKDRRRRRSEWQQWAHEDEEDERPERLRKFAPPPSYGVPSSSIPMVDVDDAVGAPLGPPPVPHAPGPPPPGPPPVPPNRLAPPGPPPPRPPSMTDAPTPNVLDKKKQAAAAIAAAFSQPKRAVPAPYRPPPPDDHTPDPTKFAERLMERYGYKQGEGLGADGNKGMVRPLEARATKRGAARGTIVNRNPDEAHAQARAQFGEPSEVIVLDHVLDTEADITRDTPQEIGTYLTALTQPNYVKSMAMSTGWCCTPRPLAYAPLCSSPAWQERTVPYVLSTSTSSADVRSAASTTLPPSLP